MRPQHLSTQLCIAGGGISGVCAALAAARSGIDVVLLQDRSVLGGNASSEIRMHIVGASCSGRRPGARESGLIDEIRVEDAVRNPHRSSSMFDLLLYDLVAREPRITLLLDTALTGCETQNGRILRVRALRNSTEEEFIIEAPFFADCSGDGRLGFEAGADYRMGREGRSEYGEAHAPSEPDDKTLGSTILFMASRKDRPVPFVAPPWARHFTEADLKLRSHREWEYGYWWAEWGGQLNTVYDNAAIRHELLRIALGVWDHIKNHCTLPSEDPAAVYDKWTAGETPERPDATAANWSLDWIGMLPGKRESRRLLGPYVLTENDVVQGRIFDDEVAYGGWWIDFHPPSGVDAVTEYPCSQVEVPYIYSIPLRCLFSRNVRNLFFAGRNISATHSAFASTRVMATCAAVGQATGATAAMAVHKQLASAADLLQPKTLSELKQSLLAADAFLPGTVNQDPADLARRAAVSASSEAPDAPASMAVNGRTRATTPALHPSLPDCSNQWRSRSLPATLTLAWPEPVSVHEVHLTFDTGFQRELTLSMSDAYLKKMIRGPQPETVSHYTLDAGGAPIVEERGNYLRKRIHRLPAEVRTSQLRLTVHATHGVPEARLFEIRVY